MPAHTFLKLLTALVVFVVSACGQSDITSGVAEKSAKELTSFDILAMDNLGLAFDVKGVISETSVTLAIPTGTNLTRLVPTLTQTGVSVSPASGVPHDFTQPSSYRVTAADGTTRTYAVTVTATIPSSKEITRFSILGLDGVIASSTIALTVPSGTNLTALVPTLSQTGVSVSPASGVAHDFSSPANYTVTAADGSTHVYQVTVSVAAGSSKEITQFSIQGVNGVIGGTNIALTLPSGTNLTSLVPTIAQTGVSVSPASGVAHDFSGPANYTVTAADGSTRIYSVTVSLALSSSKNITQFSLLGMNGVISGTNIALTLPNGSNVTALVPGIVHTGASVSPASGVAHDFTSPANYTVTAADGSTRTYVVTVAVTPTVDLNTATIVEGSAADIATWPQTTTITAVNLSGTALSVDFDKKSGPNRWPDECDLPGFVGCPGLQYTIWLFENVGGQWYGTGSIEMWFGRADTGANPAGGTIQDQIRMNWIYYSPVMSGHVLLSGEQVGIMVSGGDERRKDNTDVRERSNVVLVTLP